MIPMNLTNLLITNFGHHLWVGRLLYIILSMVNDQFSQTTSQKSHWIIQFISLPVKHLVSQFNCNKNHLVSQLNTLLARVVLVKSSFRVHRVDRSKNSGTPGPIVTELTLKLVVTHHPGKQIGRSEDRKMKIEDLRCHLTKLRKSVGKNQN